MSRSHFRLAGAALLASSLALAACEKTPPPAARQTASAAPSVALPSSSARTEAAPSASAAAEPEPSSDALCERFGSAPIPSSDRPSPGDEAALRDCDAEALYYGIDTAVDYERARRCAYTRLGRDGDTTIGGPEILMMIYANGRGVPVNWDLALRFACQIGGAPLELGGRVSRLWQARAGTQPLAKPLEVCDDVTSGFMQGYCAAHEERIAAVPRNARKRAAALDMPVELHAFEAAARRFFDARERNEVDLSGSARAVFSIEERAKLEDDYVKMLEQLRDRSFVPDKVDASGTDKKLTAQLARIASCKYLADTEALVPGAVTRAGIKKTQALWLAYRAAFVALAQKLRPDVERAAWQAFIGQKRILQLAEQADGC